MKKFSDFLLGISIIVMSTISCAFAYTKEQSDAYYWAYMYGITTQPTIEAANLDGNITRQAFSKMIINYLENVIGVKQNVSVTCTFPDENKITSDLVPYTKKTCEYGIMGSNGSAFNPMNPLSKAHLGTVLSRIIWGDEYNISGNDYYIYHLNALNQNGIMSNISNPQDYAKRGDVLIMLKRTYENFGANVSVNSQQNSNANINLTTDSDEDYHMNLEYDEDDYLSLLYGNQKIIYTGKDGIEYVYYVYDSDFLDSLKATAERRGESDLVKYLELEIDYLENSLDLVESLDLENLPEMIGIDESDIDFENMTEKEIKDLAKKMKEGINKIMQETKDRNNEYINNLGKIIKKINKDKFGLKEKYKKTKSFIEASNGLLDSYTEITFKLIELASAEDEEMDDDKAMSITFSLLGAVLSYQGVAEEYQNYLEEWAVNTIEALGGELGYSFDSVN